MSDASPETPQFNSYYRLHNLRRWLLTDADRNKAPAAGWTHPRAADVRPEKYRGIRVNQHNFYVTSNTPATWLTWEEARDTANEINERQRRRLIYPAYVHSNETDRSADDCGGYNFLDLDNGGGDDPDGFGIAFFDTLVAAFLERWPTALQMESVSGLPRRHILWIEDPADIEKWDEAGKQTRVAVGAKDWKVEWWCPFGNGRYRCYTGRWIGPEPAPDHCLPVIRYADLMDFFDNDLAGLWTLTDEEKANKAKAARGPGRPPGQTAAEYPYPPDAILAMSEHGEALRIAHYLASTGKPMTMLDNGQLLIPLSSGVLAPVTEPKGERELTALRRRADQAVAPGFLNCKDEEKESMERHQRDFLTWCNSRSTRHNKGICASLQGLAADTEVFAPLIRQSTDSGRPLQPIDLNPTPIGESLFALSDSNVYSTRRRANLNPAECYAGLRTTNAPTLREVWKPGAFISDPDLCTTEGQRYAAYIIRAWGDSWPLLVYLTMKPRKVGGCGVLIGADSDRGKTTLANILKDLGIAQICKNPPWLDGVRDNRFNFIARDLCRNRLVVFDELTKKADECKGAASVGEIKALTGAFHLPYEEKNANQVTEARQGNLLITGNHDLLIDIDDPAIADRVFFIPPPAEEPALNQKEKGMDAAYHTSLDCRLAILDAYFEQVHRIGNEHQPPYTLEAELEAQEIKESHQRFYSDWRTKKSKAKSGAAGESEDVAGGDKT